jgi:hypothetical protein
VVYLLNSLITEQISMVSNPVLLLFGQVFKIGATGIVKIFLLFIND